MGKQRVVDLQKNRYQKDISKDRWGDREQRSYIGMFQKRERERDKKKSRDLTNRSLKTDGGDREWRTYIGISR